MTNEQLNKYVEYLIHSIEAAGEIGEFFDPTSAPASKKRRHMNGLAPTWRFRHHRELWGGVGLGGVREFLKDRR